MNLMNGLIELGTHWAWLAGLVILMIGIGVILWSITFRKKTFFSSSVIKFKENESQFQLAFDYTSIGMALIDKEGKLSRVNPALCQILRCTKDELLNMDIYNIIHSENTIHFIQEMLAGKINSYECEQKYIQKNNNVIWIKFSITMIHTGFRPYFIAQFQNITAEKSTQEQLTHLAYHDSLTGLANRNKLEQQAEEVLAYARRHRSGFALILLDLDHFKIINDTIGHDAGDMLLQIISERLKCTVRNTDIVARLGGDEFVILITDISKVEPIAVIVQKVIDVLLKSLLIKGHELYITTSIGISVYPYDGHTIDVLMKNADLALYRSKELGRNNYQFCTPEMTAKAREKMARQNALSQALAKNEFYIEYQPKLDILNWRLCGVEALLRWNSEEFGIVSPGEIIKLAEEAGLIIPLSEWVLSSACKQVKQWQNEIGSPLTLSVNLSARQFKQAHFIENILKILFDNNFAPDLMEVEITESLIMQDPDHILRILHMLKQNGIRIDIDDFGTGYSSMDYLKRFSIDKIKIDKTFINKISTDPTYAAIVTAMIAMTNKLGIKTIAEGVETLEQFRFLIAEKCYEIQGYFISPPLSPEATAQFIKDPNVITRLKDLASSSKV